MSYIQRRLVRAGRSGDQVGERALGHRVPRDQLARLQSAHTREVVRGLIQNRRTVVTPLVRLFI